MANDIRKYQWSETGVVGVGGVTDHGDLTGLDEDDHDTGLGAYAQTLNFTGVPGASSGNGYRVGTVYLDTQSLIYYVLVDNTHNANAWRHGDHRFLSWNGADSHTQYVLGAGTRKQDAVRLTERADHVNTPEPGVAEVWAKSGGVVVPMFTDDADVDHQLAYVDSASQSATLTRDGNGAVETVTVTGGATWTISRNPNQSVASLTNSTYLVEVDRDGDGIVTGITVT